MTRLRGYWLPMAMVVGGAILVALLVPAPSPNNSSPASYSTGRSGTYALYHLVDSLGGRGVRLSGQHFGAAVSGSGSLVEADPTTPFTSAQVREVADFVGRGGTLLLAGGTKAEDLPLLQRLGLVVAGDVPGGTYSTVLRVRGLAGLRVRTEKATTYRAAPHSDIARLLGSSGHTWGELAAVGRGEAIVLGSEYPLSNLGLGRADNAAFALLSLGVRPGSTVLFDEIHHGYTTGDGVGALLWGTPLGAAGIAAAALLLLYLGTAGRRLGRPRQQPALGARRTTIDHLQAVAELYGRSSDRRGVAQSYLDELKMEMANSSSATAPATGDEDLFELVAELEGAARDGSSAAKLEDLAYRARLAELRLAGAPVTVLEGGSG